MVISNSLLSGRHEAYYEAKDTFTIHPDSMEPISFKQGELVNMEYSYKVLYRQMSVVV